MLRTHIEIGGAAHLTIEQAAFEPERLVRFWSALADVLRALGVTALHTLELAELVGSEIRVPAGGLSALSEVMVVLRYVELRSRLFRLISLFKVRDVAFDPTIREFNISNVSIVVGKPFEGFEAVLSGIGREVTTGLVAATARDSDQGATGGSGQSG